jgi:hypothetical protein
MTGGTGGREQLSALLMRFRRRPLGQWRGQSREIRGDGADDRSVIVKTGIDMAAAIVGRNCDCRALIFGRLWFSNTPYGAQQIGTESICDPTGEPLNNAPSKPSGWNLCGKHHQSLAAALAWRSEFRRSSQRVALANRPLSSLRPSLRVQLPRRLRTPWRMNSPYSWRQRSSRIR